MEYVFALLLFVVISGVTIVTNRGRKIPQSPYQQSQERLIEMASYRTTDGIPKVTMTFYND